MGKSIDLPPLFQRTSKEKDDKSKKKEADKEEKKQNGSEDGVYNYACRVLGMSLIARNFHHTSRFNDGERLICC